MTSSAVKSQLGGLIDFIEGRNTNLATFNFLNLLDYGHFFTVATETGGSKVTILSSYWVYYYNNINLIPSALNPFSPTMSTVIGYTFDQAATGDLLCYGAEFAGFVKNILYIVSNSYERKLATLGCLGKRVNLLAL